MKIKLGLLVGLFCLMLVVPASAQDIGGMAKGVSEKMGDMDLKNMMSKIGDGIKPDAFKGKFDLDGWKEKLSGLDLKNVDGIKDQIAMLVGGLKGSSFLKGSKKNLLGQLSGFTSVEDAPKLLGGLVKGLKPEKLTDSFKNGNVMKMLGNM